MIKTKPKTSEVRISQIISQRPVSISPVLNIRKKLMKHYIPKTELKKTKSKSKNFQGKTPKTSSFILESLPKSNNSLCSSPHKVNLNLDNALKFDGARVTHGKRFKPHLTYYKTSYKPGETQNLSISPEEKFKLLVKGSHLWN
jgi:hypothetical protein